MTNERVNQAIFEAIDDVNVMRSGRKRLPKSLETGLFNNSGNLDSLDLVELIMSVEQRIEEKFGETIVLMDEQVISNDKNPFESVGDLADYVALLLNKKPNGNA